MNLMTPTQAVNNNVNLYPTLYATSDAVLTKLRVFDQTFNVIGNGVSDTEAFIEYITMYENSPVHTPPAKYSNGEPLYTGYTKSKKISYSSDPGDTVEWGTNGSKIEGMYTEAEKVDHPDVVYWFESNLPFDSLFEPYPNFKKQYSTVWQIDIEILSTEWLDEIIWFYKKCEEFFNGENVNTYHDAVPDDPVNLAARIKCYEEGFSRTVFDYTTEKQRLALITAAWTRPGTPSADVIKYTGNTEDFVRKQWAQNLAIIKEFITETIEMLETAKTLQQEKEL